MPSERGKDGNLAQRESRVYPVFRRLAGNAKLRGIFVQTAVLFGLLALYLSSFDNTIRNIDRLGIEVGFDFLDDATGYKVKQQFIEYDEESSHWRALLVGITNTALVAACGIVLATLIGIILHGLRLSGSLLSRRLAGSIIDLLQGVPVLLQILLWYQILRLLPWRREPTEIVHGIYYWNRELVLPRPQVEPELWLVLLAFVVAVPIAVLVRRRVAQMRGGTLSAISSISAGAAPIVGLPSIVFFASGAPVPLEWPVLTSSGPEGGWVLGTPFLAICLGISFYSGARIAEILRSASRRAPARSGEGLHDPGKSTVLPNWPPLRSRFPPLLIREYLDLAMNSSLASLVAYTDVFQIIGRYSMNATGRVFECISILMLVFLAISLPLALLCAWYNRWLERKGLATSAMRGDGRAEEDGWPARSTSAQPVSLRKVTTWVRRSFFSTPLDTALTLFCVYLLYLVVPPMIDWFVLDSVITAQSMKECRELGDGACWAVLVVNLDKLLYGIYPEAQRWRIDLVLALLIPALLPIFVSNIPFRGQLLLLPATFPIVAYVLLWGKLGLEPVQPSSISGLVLNIVVAFGGFLLALPVGYLLACGRLSGLPVICGLSILVVEFVRGLPPIVFLKAGLLLPIFIAPLEIRSDPVVHVILLFALLSAVRLADVFGGCLNYPSGTASSGTTREDPASLRLLSWSGMPRAVRSSAPGMVMAFIEHLKDTTLLAFTGLLGVVFFHISITMAGDWWGAEVEVYLFIAAVFSVVYFICSRYGRHLERSLREDRTG